MAVKDDVIIRIVTETKQAVANFRNMVIGIGAAVMAVRGITRAIGDMIESYKVQEQAEAKLGAALKATGNAIGMSAQELKNYAAELQQVTIFGDEAIIEAEAMMLTFRNIGRETFPRAIEATADLATMMGTDLKSATIQLGKALNDPVVGLTALTRSGITFSEEQKELIKGFAKTNDMASAQAIILKEVEMQMGGTARAMAETATGAMAQFSNATGDLKEAGGKLIADFLEPFTRKATEAVQAMTDMANAMISIRELERKEADEGLTLEEQILKVGTEIGVNMQKRAALQSTILKFTGGYRKAISTINEILEVQVETYRILIAAQEDLSAEAAKQAEAIEDQVAAQTALEKLMADNEEFKAKMDIMFLDTAEAQREALEKQIAAKREEIALFEEEVKWFGLTVEKNKEIAKQVAAVRDMLNEQLAALIPINEEVDKYAETLDKLHKGTKRGSFLADLVGDAREANTSLGQLNSGALSNILSQIEKTTEKTKNLGEQSKKTSDIIVASFGIAADAIEGDFEDALKGVVTLIGTAFGPQGTAIAAAVNAGIDFAKALFSDPMVEQVSASLTDALKKGTTEMDDGAVRDALLEQMESIALEVAFTNARIQPYIDEVAKRMTRYVASIGTPDEANARSRLFEMIGALEVVQNQASGEFLDIMRQYNNDLLGGSTNPMDPGNLLPFSQTNVVVNVEGSVLTGEELASLITQTIQQKAAGV